ncbi:Uncharacterised protein [uncultured archaeon]|nr:Uncharacterised protein [uncultured archaeon]
MTDYTFISRAAHQVLQSWSLADAVSSEELARLAIEGSAYWEKALPDGFHLALIRLFSPVVRREEVFLGNVLLNDFLSKSLMRGVEQGGLGHIALLANDLESYYYLYHGKSSLNDINELFHTEVSASIPEIFFGSENKSRGIHGSLDRMFVFEKSDFEPFPVYSIPAFLAKDLEIAVRTQIRRLLQAEDFKKNIRKIMAALSFFYGQTSGGKGDAQSFPMFLFRLVEVYKVISAEKVLAAFGLEEVSKSEIKDKLDNSQFSPERLRDLMAGILDYFETEIESGNDEWFMGFIRKDKKMIDIQKDEFLEEILAGGQMGYLFLAKPEEIEDEVGCRLCGMRFPRVRDRFITIGINVFRFHNESAKKPDRGDDPNICAKCALSSYLQQRVLGTGIASVGGKLPQLPRLYNIIFHYGSHSEDETQRLAALVDDLFDSIRSYQQKAQGEKKSFSVDYLRHEISKRTEERIEMEKLERGSLPDMDEALSNLISDDLIATGIETLGQMKRDVQAQVLSLGFGDYHMMIFILPQFQPGRQEALDFVQRRFSKSRLAAFTLLALLRRLCGCNGPYYFQSVPTLSSGGFSDNTFYVRGKAENADEIIKRYGAIINFARKVSRYRDGHSLFADWILLAEKLEEDPMGIVSDILRNSSLRGGDDLKDAKYKRLSNEFIKGIGMVDGTEYLRMIEQLKQL